VDARCKKDYSSRGGSLPLHEKNANLHPNCTFECQGYQQLPAVTATDPSKPQLRLLYVLPPNYQNPKKKSDILLTMVGIDYNLQRDKDWLAGVNQVIKGFNKASWTEKTGSGNDRKLWIYDWVCFMRIICPLLSHMCRL
jgi:hypothetical protein